MDRVEGGRLNYKQKRGDWKWEFSEEQDGTQSLIKFLARTGGGTLPWSQSREGRSGQGAGVTYSGSESWESVLTSFLSEIVGQVICCDWGCGSEQARDWRRVEEVKMSRSERPWVWVRYWLGSYSRSPQMLGLNKREVYLFLISSAGSGSGADGELSSIEVGESARSQKALLAKGRTFYSVIQDTGRGAGNG